MSVGEHTTDSSQPCRKGRILDRMLALEAALGECQVEAENYNILLSELLRRIVDEHIDEKKE